ncbi:MAG: helix-turn-helix domain-containing protein [Clostridia bacterium]|nr:helix-turn-helix domain-containing protein [Clostridia bacterium]
MAFITDTNHVTVQGWMRTRLNLDGINLLVFAIVYSFSQDGESEFRGSIDYIKEFVGRSRDTVMRSLKYLEESKLVKKINHNTNDGKTNGYIVDIEYVNALISGVGGIANCDTPHSKLQYEGSQNATGGIANCDPIYKNISKNTTKSIEERKKVSSQGVSNKPSARVRESYDDIISKFNLSDAERISVFEFIRHCQLNSHTLTNDALTRSLEALTTYPAERRCSAVRDAIDRNRYALKPLAEKHYDMFGTGKNERSDYQSVMEDCLKEYLSENTDFVISKLWEFIQHCAANGQKLTNDRLQALCFKLKKLYRPSEFAEMRKALDKAINGGYYDIKDGDGWIAESVAYSRYMGLPLIGDDISESEDKDKVG